MTRLYAPHPQEPLESEPENTGAITFSEFARRIEAEQDAKETAEQEMVERFGMTKGKARKTLADHKETASDKPINVMLDASVRVGVAAIELMQTLRGGDWDAASDVVMDSMFQAASPRDFWKRLEDSSQEERIEE